jgi:hypothetical protein
METEFLASQICHIVAKKREGQCSETEPICPEMPSKFPLTQEMNGEEKK